MINKLQHLYKLLLEGQFKFIYRGIRKRVWSNEISFGLRKDLTNTNEEIKCFIKLSIRKATEKDHELFQMDLTNFGLVDIIPTAFVAVNSKDEPCFRQWLIGPEYNVQIRHFWNGRYPTLKKNEALIENAYTLPKYRGLGIMPFAMTKIAAKALDLGAYHVITFVGVNNIPSIKGCNYAGFNPYILRREKWFLGIRKVTFEELDQKSLEYYYKIIGRQ